MIIPNLPGPKAKAMIERDGKVISPSYPRGYPFVMDHGKAAKYGMWMATAFWILWAALLWSQPDIHTRKL
ncbi:hypothetical protein [Candidatus Villigracilis proximus]|uniref:hypothetical protein n=1 Tax=Candidatus Villigracilis proximus TaxID=3140683 RepID=UPI0031EC91D1